MKTEITKIKIQLKDRSIELTLREAEQIYDELTKLAEISEGLKPSIPLSPIPLYPTPIIIERERIPYWPQPWTITCETLCMSVGQVS